MFIIPTFFWVGIKPTTYSVEGSASGNGPCTARGTVKTVIDFFVRLYIVKQVFKIDYFYIALLKKRL